MPKNLEDNFYQLINQSIFIYIRQPEPIEARPMHIKRKKEHTQQCTELPRLPSLSLLQHMAV